NELQISENTTITGPGAASMTLSAGGTSRLFNITSQTAVVRISNLTISGGNGNPANSGFSGNLGGNIYNAGTLTLTNDIISNGTVQGGVGGIDARGGAIYNTSSATLTLDSTTITTNTARGVTSGQGFGGGIYNDASATVTLQNGATVTGNTAQGGSAGSSSTQFFGGAA